MKIWKHFCTITHHKWLVMKGCFKVGLYRQGLFHDMSKYSPAEFLVGCKYFQGNKSPNNAEREAKGYSSAWLQGQEQASSGILDRLRHASGEGDDRHAYAR